MSELVQTGTLKRLDQALAGTRVSQEQHCGDLFRNADGGELSDRRIARRCDMLGRRPSGHEISVDGGYSSRRQSERQDPTFGG